MIAAIRFSPMFQRIISWGLKSPCDKTMRYFCARIMDRGFLSLGVIARVSLNDEVAENFHEVVNVRKGTPPPTEWDGRQWILFHQLPKPSLDQRVPMLGSRQLSLSSMLIYLLERDGWYVPQQCELIVNTLRTRGTGMAVWILRTLLSASRTRLPNFINWVESRRKHPRYNVDGLFWVKKGI